MRAHLPDIAEFYMEIVRKLRFDVVILRLSSLGVTIYDIQGGSKEGIRTIKQGILVPKCLFGYYSLICVRYMDGSVFEVSIQMGGNFVYFTGIVIGVYLKLVYAWVVKTGF